MGGIQMCLRWGILSVYLFGEKLAYYFDFSAFSLAVSIDDPLQRGRQSLQNLHIL